MFGQVGWVVQKALTDAELRRGRTGGGVRCAGRRVGAFTLVQQPIGGQALDSDTRAYNALPRGLRRLGERGAYGSFATVPDAGLRDWPR